jgi:hypothetical protein
MILAGDWVTYLTNESAWDEMRELVETDPERAWRVIRAIVGAAPDYDVLAAVAAGPIEDLFDHHGESMMAIIVDEAKRDARLRICLRAAYSDFPPELSVLLEAETSDVRDLQANTQLSIGGKDLALIVAWLHHSDSAWASYFLQELTASDPEGAWDALRVLAVFAEEDARLRDDVFEDAFEPFMRRHFSSYREELVNVGRKSAAFRQWAKDRKRSPLDDEKVWAEFIGELTSA